MEYLNQPTLKTVTGTSATIDVIECAIGSSAETATEIGNVEIAAEIDHVGRSMGIRN
jgi:hypothetical protein